MSAPLYYKADYAQALVNLLPTGRVWSANDTSSTQYKVIESLSAIYERFNLRANNLLIDSFPSTTTELLYEWEQSLGLPSACAGMPDTIQERRNQVVARLTSVGGQSIAYITQFAANLGYTIEIEQFAPFRCGQSRCGHALGSDDWFFCWNIPALVVEPVYFRCGLSACGEPLQSYQELVLACELDKIAPAHTVLSFSL